MAPKGKTTKASKKGADNEVNGSGEPVEKIEIGGEQEIPDIPADTMVASKRQQKPAKTKGKEEPVGDADKEKNSKVEESNKPKDLPSKRGKKATKVQNGVDSTKEEESQVAKTDVEAENLPRSRRMAKADNGPSTSPKEQTKSETKAKTTKKGRKVQCDEEPEEKEVLEDAKIEVETKELPKSRRKARAVAEPSTSVKEQNKPEPKKTKGKVQSKNDPEEKEVSAKGPGRKRKYAVSDLDPGKKTKDENPPEVEARQLRVALKRNHSLDEMARQQMEDNLEVAEEPKAKDVKGPAKGKGKRGVKGDAEDPEPTKKAKEGTSKSKSAAKKEKDKIPDVTALDFGNESKTTSGKPWNLKIATWNVNGIRAWLEKNGMSYLHHEKPDIMCIQETKCSDDKLPPEVNVEGYHCYWLAGDKDGYSGVGLLSKEKPISIKYGINMEKHDSEGRVITAEYDQFYLVTTYIPNSGRGLVRLDYRQEWDKDFRSYLKELDEEKPVILCGDLNVAHQEIDLANPKSNKKTAGFTKEEREGFSTLLSEGFVDTFRHLYPDQTGAYTFWTYMMNARAKNVGWRLDYFVISKRFVDHLCDSVIRKDVHGSDHCPITLFVHV